MRGDSNPCRVNGRLLAVAVTERPQVESPVRHFSGQYQCREQRDRIRAHLINPCYPTIMAMRGILVAVACAVVMGGCHAKCCPLGTPSCSCVNLGGTRDRNGDCATVCDNIPSGWRKSTNREGCEYWIPSYSSCLEADSRTDTPSDTDPPDVGMEPTDTPVDEVMDTEDVEDEG